MSNFNQIIDRKNTGSVKWDSIRETYHENDLLPLWVADMDFLSPNFVNERIRTFLKTGVLGYAMTSDSLYTAIIDWQKRHHQFAVQKKEILFSAGVVPSIVNAIQAYTNVGDSILIHDPVYFPFTSTVKENQRKLVRSPLNEKNGRFEFDLIDMEEKIKSKDVKMLILCNPHNPGGRVWSKEELSEVGQLCAKYQVLVISDEIHQDLIFAPNQFTTFQNAADPNGDFSIILTAATKTFNLAGIKNSMVFIKNEDLRKQFAARQIQNQTQEINTFGLIGTEAAYQEGDQWLQEVLIYLKENIQMVDSYFKNHVPKVNVMCPEGTYLVWLDFSSLGLSDKELQERLIHKGKVLLNPGISFGPGGSGHMRMNVAAPKTTIEEGLKRIQQAFTDLL